MIVALSLIISKFAVSSPTIAFVVCCTPPFIKNSNDLPPEPWKIKDVSVAQIVTLDAAPLILFVIDALGSSLTSIKTEALGTVQVTVFKVDFTSLLKYLFGGDGFAGTVYVALFPLTIISV